MIYPVFDAVYLKWMSFFVLVRNGEKTRDMEVEMRFLSTCLHLGSWPRFAGLHRCWWRHLFLYRTLRFVDSQQFSLFQPITGRLLFGKVSWLAWGHIVGKLSIFRQIIWNFSKLRRFTENITLLVLSYQIMLSNYLYNSGTVCLIHTKDRWISLTSGCQGHTFHVSECLYHNKSPKTFSGRESCLFFRSFKFMM